METGYAENYQRSPERPEKFWAEAFEAIDCGWTSRRRLSPRPYPRHARGRLLRGTMRKIAEGETYPLPATDSRGTRRNRQDFDNSWLG